MGRAHCAMERYIELVGEGVVCEDWKISVLCGSLYTVKESYDVAPEKIGCED